MAGVITLHLFIMPTTVVLLPGTLSYFPFSPGKGHTKGAAGRSGGHSGAREISSFSFHVILAAF